MGFYYNQLSALIKRNILLKKSSKSNMFLQIIIPLICIYSIFISSRYMIKESSKIEEDGPTPFMSIDDIFYDNYQTLFFDVKPAIGFILPVDQKDDSIITQVMSHEVFNNTDFKSIRFNNEEEMKSYSKDIKNKNRIIACVAFDSKDISKYTIRVDSSYVEDPTTNAIEKIERSSSSRLYQSNYYLEIFTPIQVAVDQAIIRRKTNDNTFTMRHFVGKLGIMGMSFQPNQGQFDNIAYNIAFSFMVSVYLIALNLVKEREDNLKDGLLIAGVHPTVFWLSWYIIEGVIALLLSIIYSFIFWKYSVFPSVSPLIVFLGVFLFAISTCSIGFVFSTFFKKSKTAGIVLYFIYHLVLCYSIFIPL